MVSNKKLSVRGRNLASSSRDRIKRFDPYCVKLDLRASLSCLQLLGASGDLSFIGYFISGVTSIKEVRPFL